MESPKLISDVQLAAITKQHVQTLRNWRFHNQGPRYYKIGRSVRYAMSDVLSYFEERRIATKDQGK
jgi:predicted DNA-binding transcriptional regulator AlpA